MKRRSRGYLAGRNSAFLRSYLPTCPACTFWPPSGPPALRDAAACRAFFNEEIRRFGLEKMGKTYHAFPADGGFTVLLALTELHLSLHTWPEHGLATFDVFLSNLSARQLGHGARDLSGHAGLF
ncbi:S-adenosylmethionine decarboxylase [Hymenobacter nivis]|uniref:S-adenosylmethionine decarboxylase n=1 Tax=Hymenobacter nivis TaxID=1850093 RepID=UPI001FEB18B2|nr:S-adenosylmethionine decarboxylase [Hymenobacter nivis]